jgi:hypothetical protein
MKLTTVAMLVMAATLAACAAADPSQTREASASEREYPTGSNLPRRNPAHDGIRVHTREDLERIQQSGAPQNPETPRGR